MNILIAPDSFKGSAPSHEVGEALREGLLQACPQAKVRVVPLADGGEGTVDALVAATAGSYATINATDPLGRPITAGYGILGDKQTAVIEAAAASGLVLLAENERDASITSTYGTGQLIRHALDQGCRKLIIGLGGSATNDGGAGLAQALGARLLDASGSELPRGGLALAHLAHIDLSGFDARLAETSVKVACDVTNPLCGPEGATYIFGPQKGIASEQIKEALDQSLRHFADVISQELHKEVQHLPGAGAAGGLGAGLLAFCGASLVSGIQLVMETVQLDSLMQDQHLVITGEGRTDAQTQYGKVPQGVAKLAQAHGVPVFAVSGSLGDGYEVLRNSGITAFFSTTPGPITLRDAMAQARQNLVRVGVEIGHLLIWKHASR